MKLKEYIDSFPRSQRRQAREEMAIAHNVSAVTIHARVSSARRHPFTKKAIEITEKFTGKNGKKVICHDLRPDTFGDHSGCAKKKDK